jgi:hypothetical protein
MMMNKLLYYIIFSLFSQFCFYITVFNHLIYFLYLFLLKVADELSHSMADLGFFRGEGAILGKNHFLRPSEVV